MKLVRVVFLLAAVFLMAVTAMDESLLPALDDAMIDYINKGNFGWTAARNSKFSQLSIAQAQRLHGTAFSSTSPSAAPILTYHAEAIPNAFDSRTQWKGCVHPIRDQERCGSCWAFAGSEAFSDRLCIATGGKTNVVLSPQALVSCDKYNFGCNGGNIWLTWKYLEAAGIPSDSCYPYTSGNGVTGKCASGTCQDGSAWKVYKAVAGSTHRYGDEASIQTAIQTDGPVEAGFQVYQDFYSYSSGVYSHQSGSLLGGHAIKIIGWGVDNTSNLPYWIIANSWGEDWGMKGFFWILRGKNECGIEGQVYGALAATN